MNTLLDIDNGLRQLSLRFIRIRWIIRLVPNVPLGGSNHNRVKLMTDMAERENLTLLEFAAVASGSREHRMIVGTAQNIADDCQL